MTLNSCKWRTWQYYCIYDFISWMFFFRIPNSEPLADSTLTLFWQDYKLTKTHGCSPGETRKSCLQGLPVGLHLSLTSWHLRNPCVFHVMMWIWMSGIRSQICLRSFHQLVAILFCDYFDCLIVWLLDETSFHSIHSHMLGDASGGRVGTPINKKT